MEIDRSKEIDKNEKNSISTTQSRSPMIVKCLHNSLKFYQFSTSSYLQKEMKYTQIWKYHHCVYIVRDLQEMS
jgi:hypothetical protein